MGAEYKVLRIIQMVRRGELEVLENYYRHTIRTKGGTTLTVDIDEKDFTPEKSDPILTKKAQNADKILAL